LTSGSPRGFASNANSSQTAADRSFDFVLLLSLLLLLMPGQGDLYLVSATGAVVGLAWRRARTSAWLWFGLAAARFAGHVSSGWYMVDNHHYLLTYWCLALGASVLSQDGSTVLRLSARMLLGLCFGFAAAWKLITGEYWSGAFPGVLLLSDGAFQAWFPWSGVAAEDVEANSRAIAALVREGLPGEAVELEGQNGRVQALALALGWWTILVEFSVAAAFLAPARARWAWIGDAALLAFIATTYLLAPVIIFGLLLLTLGLAATPPVRQPMRKVYVCGWLLLPPAVFTILGVTGVGLGLSAIALLVGYLHGWGRWALLGGVPALGMAIALMGWPTSSTVWNMPLLLVMSLALLAVQEHFVGRRETASALEN
jgi:hypothetical protein